MTIFLKTRKLRQLLKFKYFNVLVVSLIASFILTLGILGSSGTDAASYDYINFQGKLTDQNGFGIVSQTKSITFCIFSASTGGSCSATPSGQLWYETKNVTTDARGIFNTALGDTTAFGTLFTNNSNNDLYLAVNVASDGEMTPRHAIGSVPKSFNSSRLEGSTWAAPGAIGTTTANSGSFTSLSASSMTISGLLVNGVVLSSSGNLISTALLNSSYGGTTWNSSSATGMVKVTSGTWSTATAGTDYVAGGVGTNHQVAFFTGAGVLSGSNNLYWDNSNVYLGVGGTPTAALHVQSSTTASYARIQGADDGDNYAALELWNSAATQKWQFALKSISGQTGDFNFIHYDGTSWSNPFTITNTGNVGIGTTSPTGRLHSYISNAAVTTSQYAGYFENLATNTTTDGINKYGLYINSTGSFTGSTGTATNNYGLYVAAPTGADNNYAAIFAGGNVGIGTSSPTRSLHLAQTTANTSSVSSPFLLNTISTGDMVDGFGGGIIFGINDNTLSTENIIATIYGIRDGADNSGALTASTYSSGTRYERLRITSAGNVGIGTTTPNGDLTIFGSTAIGSGGTDGIGNILMQNNAVRSLGVGPSITFAPSINTGSVTNTYTQAEIIGAADNSTNANAAGQLRFRVKDYISSAWSWRDAMTIRASGSVGIGTAVPATNTTLDVNGMIRSSRLGFAGTYNSAEVQGIWSIGPAYLIDTTNDDFGTLYGMGYAYNQNGGSPFAGQHQIVFTNNGTINAAISLAGQAWFASTISASNLSGSNTGDQTITLTGDVTGSGTGSFATTIAANAVDGTMIALGSDATGDIMYYNGTNYVRLAGAAGFLKSTGAAAPAWSAVTKTDVGLGNVPNLTFSGSNTGDQTITLTGDVTGSGTGSFVTTIANNSVDGTDIALGSDTTGDIMYYNGTDYVRLGGSAGFLKSTGAAAPTWSTITDADVPDTITLTNINQITNRDHGSLTGLTDDDHSIYALLAGRASGQILTGGTGSTDDLVLKTTSGAGTSGADMIFQTGTNGGTEAMRILYNGDVGIGTASPNSRLEVYRGGAVTGSNYGIGTTNSTTSSTAGISKFGIASTVTGSWNNSSTSSQTYGAQFSNSTTGGYGTYGVVAMNTSSGVYNYGGYFAAIGGGTNNYAVYANGSNGSTYNYGIYSAAGNNYMADQLALGRSNTSVGNNYYLVIGNGSSGSLYANGVIKGAGGFNGQCLIDAANQFKDAATRSCNMDIAEIYESTEDIASGDIVMIDPNVDGKVKKSTESYNSTLIGIATSTPGVILGYNGGDVMMAGQANTYMESADPRKPAIALIGKAPIKISLENGPIYKGDILTSSSTPGVAMKATKPGMAIGKALMDSSDQEDGKIMAYIHPEFVDVGGQVNSALSSINSLYDQYAQIQNEISGIRNDLLIQNVSGATGLLSPKQESILESFDINVEGHLVVKGDLEIKGKLELSNNNSRGANVVVVEGSNDLKVVFDKPRENNNYTVLVTPSWMTNFAVKKKSEKGFEVEFSVEAPENSTADWLIID